MSDACTCDPEVQRLIPLSPRLAYGVMMGLPLIQYPFTTTAGFTAAGSPNPILDALPSDDPLDRDFLIEGIDLDIQTPYFNTGSLFKPEADLAYDYTSGIQVTIEQRGLYGRQYDQIALKALPKICSELRPMPLLMEQKLLTSFFVTTPLPSSATNITITWIARTCPRDTVFRMDINKAFDCMAAKGYLVDYARRMFAST